MTPQDQGAGIDPLNAVLEETSREAQGTLKTFRDNEIVFNGSGGMWEDLAFSLYSQIVRISHRAQDEIERLNAERSDAPNPNPPNPLETAEAVIEDYLVVLDLGWPGAHAGNILRILQSHGYEITRTGGRAWTIHKQYPGGSCDYKVHGPEIEDGQCVNVREVPVDGAK